MTDWITIREFPLAKDLGELAQFIQRCQLPMRITEERNCQRLSTPDPRLAQVMQSLLDSWLAGELELSALRIEPRAVNQGDDVHISTGGAAGDASHPAAAAESPSAKNVRAYLPPSWPLMRTPLSLLLAVSCIVGFLLLRQEGFRELVMIFPNRAADFSWANSSLAWHLGQGEYWRLWTPALVHFSLPHALFNALGVWILGRPLEARAGTLAFALLVLVGGIASNLLQYAWEPNTPFGGMSGVVYALVGAVFVMQRSCQDWHDIPQGLVLVAVGWLLLCASGLITLVFGVGVANAAHVGGFIAGMLMAVFYVACGGRRRFSPAHRQKRAE